MSTPSSSTPVTSAKASEETKSALATSAGKISVADGVVSKIAGLSAREISGVHAMGVGSARAFGAIKQRIPGSSGPSVSQGVSVEVDLGRSIQRNVKQAVERMTGLEVVEVNVTVDDVYLGEDSDEQSDAPARVQ